MHVQRLAPGAAELLHCNKELLYCNNKWCSCKNIELSSVAKSQLYCSGTDCQVAL